MTDIYILIFWLSGLDVVGYTQGEVTSQNLWPRYDRHFVGIT